MTLQRAFQKEESGPEINPLWSDLTQSADTICQSSGHSTEKSSVPLMLFRGQPRISLTSIFHSWALIMSTIHLSLDYKSELIDCLEKEYIHQPSDLEIKKNSDYRNYFSTNISGIKPEMSYITLERP